jgi:cytochrome P450
MFSYMLFEPSLLQIVREETNPAFKEDGSVDGDYLMNNCPRLKGIWQETVRLTAFSSSIRYITDDTVIGGKILRKGNRVVIPYRQLHFDKTVFGDDVAEFQSDRFIKQPSLTRHPSWRPFGGGSTQCPGRFVAEQAAVSFVAMVLHRFDITLSPGNQPFPLPEEGNPVLGLMDPRKGYDLQVELSPRKD